MQVGEIKYDSYGSPQPISKLDDSQEFKGEDTKSDPPVTVSNSKKRKAETAVEKTNELETQILLPTDKDDVIYKTDNTTDTVDGPFTRKKLQTVLGCRFYQMVPCTVDELKDTFDLWMNEEAQYENELNTKATKTFGKQVYCGQLYGNVLLVKRGTVD